MSFLSPLFLVGLGALAIPVLIHLIQRERKRIVEFPSLMFLRRIPYQSVRRRRIHNWALLALRLAALLLIVSAFARPFFRAGAIAAATGGAREVIVLLDRSYSMGHDGQWARAQAAARDVISGLGAGDRASLVLFAAGADTVVRSSGDKDRLVAAVNAAAPGAQATRFGPALKLAASVAAESPLPVREVVLISDFQRAAWDPADTVRFPERTALRAVSVDAGDAPNFSVVNVSVQRDTFAGQERLTLSTGVINRGSRPAERDVVLEIDGRPVQTVKVQLAEEASQAVRFEPVIVTAETRAVVRLPQDGLAIDNAAYAVLAPPRPLGVVVLASGTGRNAALYLTRALSIGDRPRFDVSVREGDSLPDEALERARLVIVHDVAVSDALATRLARFVERGAGLLIALGPQGAVNSDTLMPGAAGAAVDRTRGPAATMGGLEFGHPVFEPFRQPRSGDFSSTRIYGYRTLNVSPQSGARVLARFDDGAPALVERKVGQGRVLVWTSSLDLAWNDLALKPVFLPFVHQMARHVASYRERPVAYTVGQVLDATPARPEPDADLLAIAPSGARTALAANAPAVVPMEEAGFYEVRRGSGSSAPVMMAASNVDLAEADRAAVEPSEVAAAVGGGAGDGSAPAAGDVVLPAEAQERVQRVWWYLLFAGILLLGAETILSHRASRVAR